MCGAASGRAGGGGLGCDGGGCVGGGGDGGGGVGGGGVGGGGDGDGDGQLQFAVVRSLGLHMKPRGSHLLFFHAHCIQSPFL